MGEKARPARTRNSLINIAVGIGGQLVSVAADFAANTLFILLLGKTYMGVNGALSSVLTTLSISELGISTAIIYALYKPLAAGDTRKVRALMRLYRRMYYIIGGVVALLGLGLWPFLPNLIKDYEKIENLGLIYFLFLAKSLVTYWFFACQGTLLFADQKKYVRTAIETGTHLAMLGSQMLLLYLTGSFALYLAAALFWQMLSQLLIWRKAKKLYPYLDEKDGARLDALERKDVFKNVFALSLYKISSSALTATDNLILSSNALMGLDVVGVYDNYMRLLSYVQRFLKLIFASLTASIGDLNATGTVEKKYEIFNCVSYLNFWLYGFCGVCAYVLFNPFIQYFWIKDASFLLSEGVLALIVVNFLTAGLQQTVITYKDACGLYWKGKLRPVASAILNVGLSLWLVNPLGLFGVVLGTILSRLLATWWFDAWLVHKYVFMRKPTRYYLLYWGYMLLICLSGVLTKWVCGFFDESSALGFLAMCGACLVVPNALFWLATRRMAEYRYFLRLGREMFGKIRRRASA